jgi:hypothetical protein
MNRNRVLALAAVASTILLTSAAARAQSLHEAAAPPASTASPEQAPTVTLRAEVLSGLAPFTPATWFDGMAELVGGSASLRLLDLVEGEVGLGFWANPCGGSLSPVARLGVSPPPLPGVALPP